jgi:diaminohydroxyphosphoribosylaminopyrimidine deaminase/5-amino-6-(5-phosphoribosylamino)uracil reductase
LNKRFFTFHEKQRPYIILKWAVSGDGLISKNNERTAISHQQTNVLVHQWRSEEQGIVIGKNTAITDNPQLNVRHVEGKNPIRFVLTSDGELPKELIILNDGDSTQIITDKNNAIQSLLRYCFEHSIISLFVEGGAYTIQKFIDTDCWDEARVIRNNELFLEAGTRQPELKNAIKTREIQLEHDIIEYFKNSNI